MGVSKKVGEVLASAEQLRNSSTVNEANTRAVLIEPMLEALGWNVSDPTAVFREYPVFDGTKLDYALLVDGKPRLFVEAKGLGHNLDNDKDTAQTINYANNEGVIWCVLTDGITYKVYKANEPSGMAEKLLLQVDLGEAVDGTGTSTEVASHLELLGPEAIEAGDLDALGDEVFADQRVRGALASMASNPPEALLLDLEQRMGPPKLDADLVRGSLSRILVGSAGPKPGTQSKSAGKPKTPKASTTSKKGNSFTLDHHTSGCPAIVIDIFNQVDAGSKAVGSDITRRIRKQYIGYFRGNKSFVTVVVRKTKVLVYLNLDPSEAKPWIKGQMRDVRNIGHFGMGDTEFVVSEASQLTKLRPLLEKAYAGAR